MRAWLAAATMACGLLGATGAGAVTFVATVTVQDSTLNYDRSATTVFKASNQSVNGKFQEPSVMIVPGDDLITYVEFSAPILQPRPGGVILDFDSLGYNGFHCCGHFDDGFFISANDQTSGQYLTGVIFDVRYFGPPFSGDSFDTAEIKPLEFQAQSLPEPAAWAAMLLGMAGMGCALRRRSVAVIR